MNSSSDVAHRVAGGFAVAPLDVAEHPFPFALVLAPPLRSVGLEPELARSAVQDGLAAPTRYARPTALEIELECLGQRRQHHLAQIPARLAPRQDDALEDRDAGIAEHEVGVHFAPGADTVAVGTGAEGGVEGELPRLELREAEPAYRTGEALEKGER